MDNKQLAAIVSTKEWAGLNQALARLDTIELLSPLMNVEELKRETSRELLDIVFVDADEYIPSDGDAKVLANGSGLYVVFISANENPPLMKKAMRAGAKDFIVEPFMKEDLEDIVESAAKQRTAPHAEGIVTDADANAGGPSKTIAFFSTKGGAGKSILAANFAVALSRVESCKVCLLDLDLQFGDLALILNVKPHATITDLVTGGGDIAEELPAYLTRFDDNLSILPSPVKPEEAELITPAHIEQITQALSARFKYVIIDTTTTFHDVSIMALDKSDEVFLVATPIILSVKNLKGMLKVMKESLEYPDEKIKIVLNRCDSRFGISRPDIEKLSNRKIDYMTPSDGNIVVQSLNRGVPTVVGYKNSKFSKAIVKMARSVADVSAACSAKTPFWKKWFAIR